MANEWNTAYPLDHTKIGSVPGEIRTLKSSTKTQIDREHETPPDGDAAGGEHSNGSAVAYVGTSTPTNRPDGSTALASNNIDKGRLWIDDNLTQVPIKRWNGSAFVTAGMSPSAYAAEESIIFPNGLILKHGYATISATTGTITFGAAFPTAVVSCSLTLKDAALTTQSMVVTDFTTVDIDWTVGSAALTGFYWQAWGY